MALNLTFTVLYDLDSDSATFGKLVFTDTTDYAAAGYDPADVIGYFNITSPLGVYRTGSFLDPDTDGAVPNFEYDGSDIPLVSTDQYLLGKYVFDYNVRISGGGDFTAQITYVLCPPTTVVDSAGYIQEACELHTINTVCQILTVTDTTVFGAYTTLDQSITISPPAFTTLPDVESNSNTLAYTFHWVNVGYSLYINDLVTYVTGNVTVQVRVTLTQVINVSPSKLAAQLLKCYVGFVNFFVGQAALKGGAYNLNPVLLADFQVVDGYMEAFYAATTIADWVSAEAYIPLIESIINQYYNCNCGCDTTKPMFVEPCCGGSGSAGSYTFLATYPVKVDVSGNTVRYYLDATWLAALADITSATVASDDESVTVTGGPDYDLSVPNTLAFTAKILYSAGGDYSVTVSNVTRQGTRYVSGYPVAAGDLQSVNYPHAGITALKQDDCVFLVKNFLTTPPGVEIPDKICVNELLILNVGESATDFSQTSKYRLEMFGRTTTGFYFRLVDAVLGTPIKNEIFIDELQYIQVNFLIHE